MKKRYSFSLEIEDMEKLQLIAKNQERSFSATMRFIVSNYVNKNKGDKNATK